MRIVSLLPSLTELVCALGHGDELVGVTHECDYPPGVELLPHLTRTRIAAGASSREIDDAVAEQGGSLYDLDARTLADLRPDLILTQAQCDVCAVNEATVRRVASNLPRATRVKSVNPTDLAGVFAMFADVANLLNAGREAVQLRHQFNGLVETIRRRTEGCVPPRVTLLEWLDPPYCAGHWNPEIIALAGGREVLASAGDRSRRFEWDEWVAARAEVLLVSPCGFNLHRGERDIAAFLASEAWGKISANARPRMALIDGSAFYSRPRSPAHGKPGDRGGDHSSGDVCGPGGGRSRVSDRHQGPLNAKGRAGEVARPFEESGREGVADSIPTEFNRRQS